MATSVARSSPAMGDTALPPTAGPSTYATQASGHGANANGNVARQHSPAKAEPQVQQQQQQQPDLKQIQQYQLQGAQQARPQQTLPPTAPNASAGAGANSRTAGPVDMRAEEDAARRLNVGRVVGSSRFAGAEARGKKTDLCGPEFRIRMERRAKNHKTAFDDEALAYLSMAAETQLRQLLASSVSAQQHRTTTSFLHPPPLTPASGPSRTKPKPMWDVSVNSDPNAVMEALNKQAKEAEREFRTSRMNRIAKEHELERIRERQAALNGGPVAGVELVAAQPPPPDSNSSSAVNGHGGDDHPSPGGGPGAGAGAHPPSSPDRSAPATPTFGGGSTKKSGSGAKSQKKNPKDVSSDVQIKMSNATAMRSAGMGKKYSWMNNAPSISSPLSGNKKKGKKGAKSQLSAEVGDEDAEGEEDTGAGAGANATEPKKRRKAGKDGDGGAEGRSKRRRMPTIPTRRPVLVDTDSPDDKFIPDDRCLTVNDLVFALEKDKGGQGMGTSDEVVRRVMARPGGPWGEPRGL